jgi:hypothetical protein
LLDIPFCKNRALKVSFLQKNAVRKGTALK